MLQKHAAGVSSFYGVVVASQAGSASAEWGGLRRLSLWEAGAAMGTVPLPWPAADLGSGKR